MHVLCSWSQIMFESSLLKMTCNIYITRALMHTKVYQVFGSHVVRKTSHTYYTEWSNIRTLIHQRITQDNIGSNKEVDTKRDKPDHYIYMAVISWTLSPYDCLPAIQKYIAPVNCPLELNTQRNMFFSLEETSPSMKMRVWRMAPQEKLCLRWFGVTFTLSSSA